MIEVYREPAARLGAILVAPRGQQAVGAGFGWGVVEEAEYLVLKAIDRVAAERSFGPVVITGFSQGGGMTYTLALRHPERFAGAVPVAGFYEERLAPIPAGANLPRFFLMNGEFDPEVENTRATQRIFKKSDLRSELRIYPAVGHAYPLARERSRELELALRFVLSTAGAAD
jgi:phospholipase/carboxylesterase